MLGLGRRRIATRGLSARLDVCEPTGHRLDDLHPIGVGLLVAQQGLQAVGVQGADARDQAAHGQVVVVGQREIGALGHPGSFRWGKRVPVRLPGTAVLTHRV